MTKGKTLAIILAACLGLTVLTIGPCAGLLYMGFKNADATVSPRIDAMFTAIENDSFADTYETETTPEYREAVNQEKHADIGNGINVRLGKLKTKKLKRFNLHRGNDSYLDATYDATFEKGSGTIKVRMKKQAGEWKFTNFRVVSPVFEQDLATEKCPSCGAPHTSLARFCPACGAEVSGENDEGSSGPR